LCVNDSSETVGEDTAAREGVFVSDLHHGGSVGGRGLAFFSESEQFEVGDAPRVGLEDSTVVELDKLVALWEWGAASFDDTDSEGVPPEIYLAREGGSDVRSINKALPEFGVEALG